MSPQDLMSSQSFKNAVFALEDGTVFRAKAFGAEKTVTGEAVFNTGMTGYQEILTDPSYYGQIITMTAPHIGNTGVNHLDAEASHPWPSGFVVRELSPISSNWRSQGSLNHYLERHGIPGITQLDTRTIAKHLRTTGALNACLSTEEISDEEAIHRARTWEGLVGKDYVKEVTPQKPYEWDPEGKEDKPFTVEGLNLHQMPPERKRFRVAAIDLGAKKNIFRKLRQHTFEVHVFPANASVEAIREINPHGIFLSNGPGDPSSVPYAHKLTKELIEHYPTFGICMGHQILTHAIGAKTFKLKFGHRGCNQPVKNLENERVSITSQNHGFASTEQELLNHGAIVTEINLNDHTIEGMRHKDLPFFSVQYHPEASPGPHDSDPLFEDFYKLVAEHN